MKNYHFETIDSTSTYLKKNYENLDNLTFVSADYQTQGHGRNGRIWFSKNKENLLFSVLIKDKELISKFNYLSLSSAVCIYKILKEFNINNVSIKWPNDVLVNDKKIAGILLESVSTDKGIEALIIGVGLNVNSSSFENNMINNPTSIYLELKTEISLDLLKDNIYKRFSNMLYEIKDNNYSYLKTVKENNYLKNKEVYANINSTKTLIKVIDINDDNSLKVIKDNKIIDLYSGEISFHK